MLTGETRDAALARIGRALADPTRCRILTALLDGPAYPGRLAGELGLSRSNVSNHLSCLRGCGLVVAGYEGRQVRYEIADAPSGPGAAGARPGRPGGRTAGRLRRGGGAVKPEPAVETCAGGCGPPSEVAPGRRGESG
jgi:DNA-binding transcriptional ArsR family regulator